MELTIIKKAPRGRIGLYCVGLNAYWPQFKGLKVRMIEYCEFVENKISLDAEVFNYGMVDTPDEARKAGEWFNEKNVDLIFCHSTTYVSSDCVVPVHQICKVPCVVLNLQPSLKVNYSETSTGEWLAHCGACPTPEISNAFNRAGITFQCVNGLLGLDYTPEISVTDEVTYKRPEAIKAWEKIREYVLAAGVKRMMSHARFGFLGNTFNGMLDMYSDLTMLQGQLGLHMEIIEMSDLYQCFMQVTDEEIEEKKKTIYEFFTISGDSVADPIAKKPTPEQIEWSAKVAVAQEKMVKAYNLDALTYYYHGAGDDIFEKIQGGFIVGHSLLTASGIPCAGEGDVKTNIAMKICDYLGVGGSYCEIVTTDYTEGTILLGHDGPFHVKISNEKPILRGMGLYHGKRGSGVSVEAKVTHGPITMLGVTQTREGKLKFNISEGEATANEVMQIGNTQTHVKFSIDPDAYFDRWFKESPTHHCAMSIGHNASLFVKVAEMMNIPYAVF